jgi:hypothetical protein
LEREAVKVFSVNPGSFCIFGLFGLIVVAAVAAWLVLRSEKPGREEIESAALIHWKFTAEQWHAWARLEWAPAQEQLKKVMSKPFTWLLVVLVVVPLLVLPAVAYIGVGWWLALITFALLMIVPFTFFVAYRWIPHHGVRLLRMLRQDSGEVWVGPTGIRDSLGRSVRFHDERHHLVQAETRSTPFGLAIYLESLSFARGVPDMGVDYVFSSSFLIPVPPGKENEAELAAGVLRGEAHLPPKWARDYLRKHERTES